MKMPYNEKSKNCPNSIIRSDRVILRPFLEVSDFQVYFQRYTISYDEK